jgi:hypothetical protein
MFAQRLNRRSSSTALACALLMAVFAIVPAAAQEGHPLSGSWHGAWHPTASQRVPVLIYMMWDSQKVVGTINPGPHAIPLKVATLDADNWTVHFEGDGKDASGNPVHIVIDGKLSDIGSYHRKITGTWTQGSQKGDFEITRD